MERVVKFIFMLLLYCSNISTAIFIYPIIYFMFDVNDDILKWYHFGIILAAYETGKFFGLFLWDLFSRKFSNVILIIVSLSFICILNLSYIFASNIFHILILRFFSGYFNNIGKFSKQIYIQLGIKEGIQFIIFIISIICTLISLFLPSFISQKIIGKNKLNKRHIEEIYQITLYFSIINFLSIVMCLVLVCNKILRIRRKYKTFIQASNNLEKLEYSSRNMKAEVNLKTKQSTNRSREIKHSKKYIKMKENIDNQNSGRVINSYGEKVTSNRYDRINKKEEESKLGKRGSINLFDRSKNSETGGKYISPAKNIKINYNIKNRLTISDQYNKNKIIKYTFIHILTEISDTLSLIWILIILHIEYHGNCLIISSIYAFIRLLGEIISFPINTIIIKNISSYSQNQFKNFLKNIIIMSVLLFFISIISNSSLLVYYKYFKNKIMLFILYSSVVFKNIFTIINIQLIKIFSAKDFHVHSINMISLGKHKQYFGSLSKAIIFIVGSYGHYLINDNQNISNKYQNILFILYFIVFPAIIKFLLILAYKLFI